MYQLPAMISSAFTITSYVGVTISLFVQTKTAGAMKERKEGGGGGKPQLQIQNQPTNQP